MREGRGETRSLGCLPSSLPPRIRLLFLLSPAPLPARPFPLQQEEEGAEGPRAAAATCRGVEKLRLSLTQWAENGSFLQDPFRTHGGTEWGFGGPVHAGAATVALAGWFRTAAARARGTGAEPPPLGARAARSLPGPHPPAVSTASGC